MTKSQELLRVLEEVDQTTFVKVKDLKPGMKLDLEGDKYADPDGMNQSLPYEYAVVEEVANEEGQYVVYFEEDEPVVFPPNHKVKVVKE